MTKNFLLLILIVFSIWACSNPNNQDKKESSISKDTIDKPVSKPDTSEQFPAFLEMFSSDSEFQVSRIKFPLPDIDNVENEDGTSNSSTLSAKEWHKVCLMDTTTSPATIQTIYDNFDMQLRNTDERVLASEAVETDGTNNAYFFKRIDGKWFLVKREHS